MGNQTVWWTALCYIRIPGFQNIWELSFLLCIHWKPTEDLCVVNISFWICLFSLKSVPDNKHWIFNSDRPCVHQRICKIHHHWFYIFFFVNVFSLYFIAIYYIFQIILEFDDHLKERQNINLFLLILFPPLLKKKQQKTNSWGNKFISAKEQHLLSGNPWNKHSLNHSKV